MNTTLRGKTIFTNSKQNNRIWAHPKVGFCGINDDDEIICHIGIFAAGIVILA